MSRIYLSKADKVEKYENHLVSVSLEKGDVVHGLEPRRLFPVTSPDHYITLLNEDGKEVMVIRALSDLDPASAKVIEESLADYYLVPKILRIISQVEKYGTHHWVVETDRGICEFDIRNLFHDIHVMKSGLVRVRDANDNRYVIENVNDLDKYSAAIIAEDT